MCCNKVSFYVSCPQAWGSARRHRGNALMLAQAAVSNAGQRCTQRREQRACPSLFFECIPTSASRRRCPPAHGPRAPSRSARLAAPQAWKTPKSRTPPKRKRQNQTARAMNAQGRPQRRAADAERPGERPCGPRWCCHRGHRTLSLNSMPTNRGLPFPALPFSLT